MSLLDPQFIIERLGLQPHPEGGYFAETWRAETSIISHPSTPEERAAGSAIYYLLQSGEISHWHRVDAAEIWHFYGGSPLVLSISTDGRQVERQVLGHDLWSGELPQKVVPPHAWQSAESLGDWTLVGCTVSPAFQFERFELAPPDWSPGR